MLRRSKIRKQMIQASIGSLGSDEPGRRERRRRAIIAAARALFLEKGFDAVSLNEIVRRSGGSLATLYALFESKAGLLGAIVADNRFEAHKQIGAMIEAGGAPRPLLRAIATILNAKFMDKDAIGMSRLVMAESLRDPSIARIVYEVAHRPTLEQLALLFGRWADEGRGRIADPLLAAEFFAGLVLHGAQTRALFANPCRHAAAAIDDRLDQATDLFLAGYGIATEGPA